MLMVPDTDNHSEMWMVIHLVGGIARSNEWVFLGVLLLLIMYIIGRLGYTIVKYLFVLYRQRLNETEPYAQHFRIALGIAAAVGLIGLLLINTYEYQQVGKAVLANDFCLFSLFSVGYDWYLNRKAPAVAALPEGTTYDDILAWQSQVNDAYDAGLMTRL